MYHSRLSNVSQDLSYYMVFITLGLRRIFIFRKYFQDYCFELALLVYKFSIFILTDLLGCLNCFRFDSLSVQIKQFCQRSVCLFWALVNQNTKGPKFFCVQNFSTKNCITPFSIQNFSGNKTSKLHLDGTKIFYAILEISKI